MAVCMKTLNVRLKTIQYFPHILCTSLFKLLLHPGKHFLPELLHYSLDEQKFWILFDFFSVFCFCFN